MKRMKRIVFIALAAVLALSVGLIGCDGNGEEPDVWDSEIALDMHATITPFASIVQQVFSPWVDAVHALVGDDGGTFNITMTAGDAPFDAAASLAALTAGTVDIAQLSPDTFHLGGIGYMPFLSPSIEATAYATYYLWTENDQGWDTSGQLSGIKFLITAPLWGAQLWTTDVGGNVTQLADFEGMDIRSEGAESTTILALNASPIYLGTSELGTALQTHIVNGCFFTYTGWKGFSGVGPNTDYTTELNMFYRPYSLAINKASYDALPTDAKTALDSVCGAAQSVVYATAHQAAEAEDRGFTETDESFGRPIYVPSPAEMLELEAATAGVATAWEAYLVDPLEFPEGIVARYEALIAEYLAL